MSLGRRDRGGRHEPHWHDDWQMQRTFWRGSRLGEGKQQAAELAEAEGHVSTADVHWGKAQTRWGDALLQPARAAGGSTIMTELPPLGAPRAQQQPAHPVALYNRGYDDVCDDNARRRNTQKQLTGYLRKDTGAHTVGINSRQQVAASRSMHSTATCCNPCTHVITPPSGDDKLKEQSTSQPTKSTNNPTTDHCSQPLANGPTDEPSDGPTDRPTNRTTKRPTN